MVTQATEFDQVTLIDALRYHEFEETNPIHQLVVDDTLSIFLHK